MIKNKLDFKLINIAIFTLIVFLVYQTGNLWLGLINKVWSIAMPFFFAFIIAYALHPFVDSLIAKKVPKALSIGIVVGTVIAIFSFTIILLVPLLTEQLTSLFNYIIVFVKELSVDYDINSGPLQETLSTTFNNIIANLGTYVSDGAVNIINVSISMISQVFIIFSVAIYFLIDFDEIRNKIKRYLRRKSTKTYLYFKVLDNEMKLYINGFVKIMFITLFEYTAVYFVIGHPNAILLGFLAVVGSLIPYFGGMIVNTIAAITAFVASPGLSLFIRTCIAFFVLSNVDGYIINPAVYGKTNKIHPLVVILSVFAGGIIFGIIGIVISLPLSIIIIATYKFYKKDITEKIEDIKEKNLEK
ncbi:MAG: AI-2E family transporter [Bacilli bacterium]|nr:AI-2E family transporter [Bacilli bacterium]